MKSKEFLTNEFYNLEGITIGERQRNLHLFADTVQKTLTNHSDIETLLSTLTPKTHLENLFKIDLLKHFKCYGLLMDVLKTENAIFIKKVLKDHSFINYLFESRTPESFINEFLPQVSCLTRLKLLNKFSGYNNPEVNHKLFESCVERYGLNTALLILGFYDNGKIESLLQKNKIKLRPNILLKLAKKNINLCVIYIEQFDKKFGFNSAAQKYYKSVFEFIASTNPKVFFELKQKYRMQMKLGRKTTKYLIHHTKTDLMNKPLAIIDALSLRELSEYLVRGGDFKEFYCTVMKLKYKKPRADILESDHTLNVLTKHLTKTARVELYTSALQSVYGVSLNDHPELIHSSFLYQIASAGEREKYLKSKLSEQTDCYNWMIFCDAATAVDYYKKKLKLTADYTQRANLLNHMMEACFINNDKEKLLEVCKYVCDRHRNDDVAFRMEFLYRFFNLSGDMSPEKLTEGHWNCVKQFLIIADLNKENVWYKFELMIKYLKWHYFNQVEFDYLLLNLLKEFPSMDFNLCKDVPELEKICLSIFYRILPEVFVQKVDLVKNDVRLYLGVNKWNLQHPHSVIDIKVEFPRLIESLKSSFADTNLCSTESKEILRNLIRIKKEEEFFVYYWNNYEYFNDENVNLYFLRNNPTQICKNLETYTNMGVLNKIKNKSELNFCKKLSHLGLPDVIITGCKHHVENHTGNGNKRGKTISTATLRILAYMMPPFDYLEFIKDKSMQNVAVSFKYVQPASLVMPEVITYCTGKHMRTSLKALYAIIYNTPEYKLPPYIEQLAKRPISVRKHAIFITYTALPIKNVHDYLQNLVEKEIDVSAFKYIYRIVQKLLVQTPTDDNWDLFKTCTLKIDKNDKEALEQLINTNNIPPKYLVSYVEFAWNLLYRYKNKHFDKFALLNSINAQQFVLLPNTFCCKIIEEYFLIERNVNEFVVMSLFHFQPEDLYQTRLILVFEILRKRKELAVTQNIKSEVEFRRKIKVFLEDYYKYALKQLCYSNTKKFFDKWNETFQPQEFFEEYLSLQIILVYLESSNNYVEFNTKICELLHVLTLQYTPAIVSIFAATLESIFDQYVFVDDEEYKEEVLYDLYKHLSEMDISSGALTVFKMIDRVPFNPSIKKKYFCIISKLKERPEKDIEIYLNLHKKAVTE